MGKIIPYLVIAIFMIFFISLVSAEIIINQQPGELYNMGDIVKTSFKIITPVALDPDTFFLVNIFCNGIETRVMQSPVSDMSSGEEREFSLPIPMLEGLIGRTTGICKIKAVLQTLSGIEYEYVLTQEFQVSDLINVEILSEDQEFNPGEEINIEGEAIKENGNAVKSGIVELKVNEGNSTIIEKHDTIKNGYFFLNFSTPTDIKAGQYNVNIKVYQTDSSGKVTNKGFANFNLLIKQVPTTLEIFIEDKEVEPGTNLEIKGILHDQTGEKIEANVMLTVKNNKDEIIEQAELKTDNVLEVPIPYNEPPLEWTVSAVSNELTTEIDFEILEKEAVKVELLNNTILITNVGNIAYNKSLSIKIGNESLNIDVYLDVDKSQKYILKAPDGEYEIEVLGEEGNLFNGRTLLTGKAVEIKKVSSVMTFMRYPLVWIFIFLVLGFVAFMIFKKGYKKSFFGRINLGRKRRKKEPKGNVSRERHFSGESLISGAKNRAQLSLSLKGDKQGVSVVCVKIKNLKDFNLKKGDFAEVLNSIINAAEREKAFTYENQNYLFFIVSAIGTRTFKNEKIAINIAEKISKLVEEYNKLTKQKLNLGIAVHYGQIIAKREKGVLYFMSLGTLVTNAKKIAGISDGEVLLTKEVKSRLLSDIKTEKTNLKGEEVYTVKEIRHVKKEDKKFISNFLKRLEADRKK